MSTNVHDVIERRQYWIHDWQDQKAISSLNGHGSHAERLGYVGQLESHRGCVNCLQWNSDGSLLASGSDDLTAIIWDPYKKSPIVVMPTGHTGNIFSVNFVPGSGDRQLLTGAEDKEVRLHDVIASETTQVWSCSHGRVKRIATSPQQPHLCWSAAEDGCIRQLDLREPHMCQPDGGGGGGGGGGCRNVLIDLKPTCGPYAQCKCLAINPVRSEQIAVGAMDAYVRLYDARVLRPKRSSRDPCHSADPSCIAHFAPGHMSNTQTRKNRRKGSGSLAATYVTFNSDGSELLVNLSGEHIYLYDTVCFREALSYSMDGVSTSSATSSSSSDTTQSCSARRPAFSLPPLTRHKPSRGVWCTSERSNVEEEEGVLPRVKQLKEEGNKCYEKKDWTGAIFKYSSAISMCPNWHVLYSNRAIAYYYRKWDGDVYASLRDTELALQLCAHHKKTLQRRLWCLNRLNLLVEAKRFLMEYKGQFPDDKDFYAKFLSELEKAQKQQTETAARNGQHNGERRHTTLWEVTRQTSADDYIARYCGHCNMHTDIKEASFLGPHGDCIAAGSDDGNIFVWEKATGNLIRVLHGDASIVNCIQWHPCVPILATSGIESVVRLWEPKVPGCAVEERLVENVGEVSASNQRRMQMDLYELMLMRMGMGEAELMGLSQRHAAGEEGEQAGCRSS